MKCGGERVMFKPSMYFLFAIFLSTSAFADDWFGEDKVLHWGAMTIVSGAGYGMSTTLLDEPWQRGLVGFGAGMVVGSLKELADHLNDGVASWQDMAWNGLGSLTGAGVGLGIDYLFRALTHKPNSVATQLDFNPKKKTFMLAFSLPI